MVRVTVSIVLFCCISYFAIVLDGVHLSRRATSAPDTDSASLLLLIIFFVFFVVAILCVNKDVYIEAPYETPKYEKVTVRNVWKLIKIPWFLYLYTC